MHLDTAAADASPTGSPAPASVAALAAVRAVLDPYRPARPDLWDAVLPGWADVVAGTRVVLVADGPGAGTPDVVLDLTRLLAAAEPGGVAQAAQRQLDRELARVVLAELHPPAPNPGYEDRLDQLAWDEGIALHLAMGTHRLLQPGSADREDRRLDALTTLSLALAATDPAQRERWWGRADADGGFWDRFAAVAGLLACVDAEHLDGPAGVRALVEAGRRGFARRLLDGDALLSRA